MEAVSTKNLIEDILSGRKRDVRAAASVRPVSELKNLARKRKHRSLAEKMKEADRPCIIAEMKKASPSAGILCQDYRPDKIARDYAAAGASAVSVLTEPHHFLGDINHLKAVRKAENLPILRKDFICDPYQVYESAAMGADIILLIARALTAGLLAELNHLALSLDLEVLIESHTEKELETAIAHPHALLGINNRDIQTLKTDLNVGVALAGCVPRERLAVIESGIKTRQDIDKFWFLGYRGFLIGEALMRSPESGLMLGKLAGTKPGK